MHRDWERQRNADVARGLLDKLEQALGDGVSENEILSALELRNREAWHTIGAIAGAERAAAEQRNIGNLLRGEGNGTANSAGLLTDAQAKVQLYGTLMRAVRIGVEQDPDGDFAVVNLGEVRVN